MSRPFQYSASVASELVRAAKASFPKAFGQLEKQASRPFASRRTAPWKKEDWNALKEAWDAYNKAYDQYRSDLIDYEAEQHGVSREHYLAARERLNEYNRKKCDKAEERTIDYYLSNTLEVPDDEIIVAS